MTAVPKGRAPAAPGAATGYSRAGVVLPFRPLAKWTYTLSKMSQDVAPRSEPREAFHLGEWLVQPSLNRLSDGSRTIQIEPRAMDVLAYLALHAGRVVRREEILDAVWQRRFVADATLYHAVAELRRALGDDAQRPRFIETISKRGYRLIAPVSDREPPPATPAAAASGDAGAPTGSVPGQPIVAVLPFVDMSPGRDQEYLCDGVAEEITNALAQLEGLGVAARTSAFAFKGKIEDVREIGRRLAVDVVLEGSVRKAGDRLRVTVQLISVADGLHVWSQRFDGTDEDIFAIQDEISLGVVDRLKVRLAEGEASLLGRRSTASRHAYDLYLRGRHLLNRRRAGELQRAVEYFEQAIAIDPAYALPHVAIAETFSILGLWGFLPPDAAFGRAKVAASRAVAIDDALAEAHAWLATILYFHEWDWPQGNEHFQRALQLPRPGWASAFCFGLFHLVGGRRGEAFEVTRRLVEAEPLSSIAHTQAAALSIGLADFDRASAWLEKALELDPDLPMALLWTGFCRGAQGRSSDAVGLLRSAADKGLTASMIALPAVLVRAGDPDAGREAVAALERTARERYVTPITRALAWAALDDKARCLDMLALAEREKSPMFTLALFGSGFLALAPSWVQEWFAARRGELGPDVPTDLTPLDASGPTGP